MSTRLSSFATKNYPLSIVVRIVEWKTQRLSFLPNNMVPVRGQKFLLHRVCVSSNIPIEKGRQAGFKHRTFDMIIVYDNGKVMVTLCYFLAGII